MSDWGLEWGGDELEQDIEEEIGKAVRKCGLFIKSKSAPLAPIESGDLRGNCSVTFENKIISQPEGGDDPDAFKAVMPDGEALSAKVGYTLPYALRQHEELGYNHLKTDGYRIKSGKNAGKSVNMVAGGQAKYLEQPFLINKRKCQRFIEQGILRAVSNFIWRKSGK